MPAAACYVGDATMSNQILNSTLIPRSTCGSAAPTATRDAAVRLPVDQAVVGRGGDASKNQDVTIQAGFQAFMHATLGYTMSVSRFRYVPTSSGCRTFLASAAETQRCLLIDLVAVQLALPRAATL